MSLSEVKSLITELSEIKNQNNTLNLEIKKNQKRQKVIETKIEEFLLKEDKDAINFKNICISLKDKKTRQKKNKSVKVNDCINLLKKNNVSSANEVLVNDIINVLKGDEKTKKCLIVDISKVK